MCGIIGALKKDRNAVADGIAVLKKLEYRGYDSAGMAIKLYQECMLNSIIACRCSFDKIFTIKS